MGELLLRWRDRITSIGKGAKTALDVKTVLLGAVILTGSDQTSVPTLFATSPDWLASVATRFSASRRRVADSMRQQNLGLVHRRHLHRSPAREDDAVRYGSFAVPHACEEAR